VRVCEATANGRREAGSSIRAAAAISKSLVLRQMVGGLQGQRSSARPERTEIRHLSD